MAGSKETPGLQAASITAWRILVILSAILVAAYVAGKLRVVVAPLLIAVILAALVRPAVDFLRARDLPRVVAVILPMFGVGLAICGSLALVAFSLESESEVLAASIESGSEAVDDLIMFAERHFGDGALERFRDWSAFDAQQFSEIVSGLIRDLVYGVFIFALACIFCFFFLLDLEVLDRAIKARISSETYRSLKAISEQIWDRLEKYLGGLTITAAANALMFGLGLLLIGVPLVLPNMVLTFIGSFIPYLGPVIATIFASVLALGHSGPIDALLVVGLGALVQAIEGNLLHPFVVGHAVSIPPFVTLLAIGTFGAVGGLVGALVAVPAAVVLVLLFDAWRTHAEVVTPDEAKTEL